MRDALDEYLRATLQRRFAYGGVGGACDCFSFAADWWSLRHGFDFAAEWRGRYCTALGAARILRRSGGLVAHMDQCLRQFGGRRIDAPSRGDIAVILVPEGETVALATGQFFACVGDRKVFFRRAVPLAAWTC